MHIPILSVMLCLPLMGGIFIFLMREKDQENPKYLAIIFATINLLIAFYLLVFFNKDTQNYQFIENYKFFDNIKFFKYHLGIDGISLSLLLLTNLLMVMVVLYSFKTIKNKIRNYMAFLMLLHFCIIGSFIFLDMVMFYICFEAALIPMFAIIGIWGGSNRYYACYKFFIFTFAGSILILASFIKIISILGHGDIMAMDDIIFSPLTQLLVFTGLFIGFAIKIPVFPMHTWLPLAHVEAPTGGSVILAGILLKLGGYGIIRFGLPFMPKNCLELGHAIAVFSLLGIIYGSFVAFAQKDIKKLIAYSSIAHMGFVTMSFASVNEYTIKGAVIQMISHGLISAGLFFTVGFLYERFHTRKIADYGGICDVMPLLAALTMFLILGSISLPGTSGFVGEFLLLLGIYKANPTCVMIALIGTVLSAVYGLFLYAKVFFGKINPLLGIDENFSAQAIIEKFALSYIEKIIILVLVGLIIFIGLCPQYMIDLIDQSTQKITSSFNFLT